jgi:hypothetical protein
MLSAILLCSLLQLDPDPPSAFDLDPPSDPAPLRSTRSANVPPVTR